MLMPFQLNVTSVLHDYELYHGTSQRNDFFFL